MTGRHRGSDREYAAVVTAGAQVRGRAGRALPWRPVAAALTAVLLLAPAGCSRDSPSGNPTPEPAGQSGPATDRSPTGPTAEPTAGSGSPTATPTGSGTPTATPGATESAPPATCTSVLPRRVGKITVQPARITEVVTLVSDGRSLTAGSSEQSEFVTPVLTGPDGTRIEDPNTAAVVADLIADGSRHRCSAGHLRSQLRIDPGVTVEGGWVMLTNLGVADTLRGHSGSNLEQPCPLWRGASGSEVATEGRQDCFCGRSEGRLVAPDDAEPGGGVLGAYGRRSSLSFFVGASSVERHRRSDSRRPNARSRPVALGWCNSPRQPSTSTSCTAGTSTPRSRRPWTP